MNSCHTNMETNDQPKMELYTKHEPIVCDEQFFHQELDIKCEIESDNENIESDIKSDNLDQENKGSFDNMGAPHLMVQNTLWY